MTTKILLLGSTGQVGWELNRTLLTLGVLTALDYPEIDLADPDSITSLVREVKPNLIVNATAYTDVDKAEQEPDLAMAVNGTGPGILAEEARRLNSALIHYSTDYVFDGTKGEPYTEEDIPNPLNVYGKTKLAGERAIQDVGGAYLIFRTSWVYSLRRPCFVTKVLQWARENETLRIVDDQVSSPTWARTLAEVTMQVVAQGRGEQVEYIQDKRGLYHLAGGGSCSRYEWAKLIINSCLEGDALKTMKITPAKSDDFDSAVSRPNFSGLNSTKIKKFLNINSVSWKKVLQLAMTSVNF